MSNMEAAKQLFFTGLKAFQEADFIGAEHKFRQALDLVPDRNSILVNLSATLLQLGKLGEARELLEKATTVEPDNAESWLNLGLVNAAESRYAEAIQCMDKAIQLEPEYADAWMNKGLSLSQLHRYTESLECIDKAIVLNPSSPEPYYNYGNTLGKQGKPDAALTQFMKALDIKPDFSAAYKSMANTYAALGKHDMAVDSWYKAIDIEPDNVNYYRNLGYIKKYKPGDERFERLQSLLDDRSLKTKDKIYLHFALAKAYEDIDEIRSAFEHYELANHFRKSELGYNIETDKKLFSGIKTLFESNHHADPSTVQNEYPVSPIFIVGMPRSGTSLVEQILASHSSVYGAGELGYLAEYAHPIVSELQDTAIQPDIIEQSRQVMAQYLAALGEFEIDEKIIADKMPMNFLWLGFVLTALPDAKIINLVRNPAAICWSSYKLYFPAKGIGFAYDLQDLADYFCLYTDLMRFWRDRFPGRIYDLDYEALTENQEVETRRLLKYCGLEWEDGCLEFEKTDRAVKTASHLQVRQGMYQGSSNAWRKYQDYLSPIVNIECGQGMSP